MELTAQDIQKKKFRLKFRGFDVRQVDDFLHVVAEHMETLEERNAELSRSLESREKEVQEMKEREAALRSFAAKARAAEKEIQKKAEKEAELIISKAEVTAEKILNNAHHRLAQLHEDIAELKRQRMLFEVKLRSFIEAHLKFLDMEKEDNRDANDLDDKVRFMKRG